jgi:hypothetical protein
MINFTLHPGFEVYFQFPSQEISAIRRDPHIVGDEFSLQDLGNPFGDTSSEEFPVGKKFRPLSKHFRRPKELGESRFVSFGAFIPTTFPGR